LNATPDIERWLRGQWQEHTPPFYGSVDLRNAGFKLAPVDMNLFPGGFNNLNSALWPLCVQAAMTAIEPVLRVWCVGSTGSTRRVAGA
jgi:glutamate--cysteine ligase